MMVNDYEVDDEYDGDDDDDYDGDDDDVDDDGDYEGDDDDDQINLVGRHQVWQFL